jgi:hypothetical protein
MQQQCGSTDFPFVQIKTVAYVYSSSAYSYSVGPVTSLLLWVRFF